MKDKDSGPTTIEVDDEDKVMGKEVHVDVLKADVVEEIEHVDLTLISKPTKVY